MMMPVQPSPMWQELMYTYVHTPYVHLYKKFLMIFASVLMQAGVRIGSKECHSARKNNKSHLPTCYYAYPYSQFTKIFISWPV